MDMVKQKIGAILAVFVTVASYVAAGQTAPEMGWTLGCSTTHKCTLINEVVAKDTGLTTRLELTMAEGTTSLVVMSPLGIDLQAGITLQVDEGRTLSIVPKTCEVFGCVFYIKPDQTLINAFQTGQRAHVRFLSADKTISFDMPHHMNGFAANFVALEKLARP
jgi:invasion protein IalB